MPLNDPSHWKELTNMTFAYQNLYALAIAFAAGTVAHIEKIQNKTIKGFHFVTFVYDLLISSFVGIITLYVCLYFHLDAYATGACCGIMAHQGTRGLALLTNAFVNKFGIKIKDLDKEINQKDKKC